MKCNPENFRFHQQRRANRRTGTVFVAVLVCLAAAGAIFVAMLSDLRVYHRQANGLIEAAQARWLVESAIQRGVARTAAETDFASETWQIAAAEAGGSTAATVRLEARPSQESTPRSLRVIVELTGKHGRRVKRTMQIRLPPLEDFKS